MQNLNRFLRLLLMVSILSAVVMATARSQTFVWLGTLEPATFSSAQGVSSDGVVVGWSVTAFRWTASTGMQDLGTLGGATSHAWGISADGSVIVGSAQIATGQNRAFRWTQATGMQDLGVLAANSSSHARAASGDGSVVVGYALNDRAQRRAFRWTQATGLQDLGTLGGSESWANGVSGDGSVIVGAAETRPFGPFLAFRWESGVMQALGTLGGISSSAYAVSADGSVVVGLAEGTDGLARAFRWTQATGMQDLGALPGFNQSTAYGVSADGSVVVGSSGGRAFRWTPAGGMEDLNETYAGLFNGQLQFAFAVSGDGRFIVGQGYNLDTYRTEGFLIDTQAAPIPEPSTLLLTGTGLCSLLALRRRRK
jgi:probable HAF family extracellular repeat protein